MEFINKVVHFVLPVGAIIAVVILLLFTDPITERSYLDMRYGQLQAENYSNYGDIMEYSDSNDAFINEFFELNNRGYRYKGGLFNDLVMDSAYLYEEILTIRETKKKPDFISFGWEDDQKIYINVDRVQHGTVKEFLKKLDVYNKMEFRELWIDLRFIRSVEFGVLLSLGNQWCNRDDFELAQVMSLTGTEEINASGNPFFNAEQFYFLLSQDTPEVVKKMAITLSHLDGYDVIGDFVPPADTICIRSRFRLEDARVVDVCNKLLISDNKVDSLITLPNGENIEQYRWKEQSSQFHDLYYALSPGNTDQLKKIMGRLISEKN